MGIYMFSRTQILTMHVTQMIADGTDVCACVCVCVCVYMCVCMNESWYTYDERAKRYTLPGISVSMKDRAQETCACEFYCQQR